MIDESDSSSGEPPHREWAALQHRKDPMKALLSFNSGAADTLRVGDLADPVPQNGEVRIAVKACAINFPDVLMIEDKYQFRPPRPFAPGVEVAGVVESLAADVSDLRPGQRVMASVGWGGLAELVVAARPKCTLIPDSMPFDEAAAFQVIYGTAYHALVDRAGLKKDETLLVLGAAGGVGIAAIEVGRALGARVIAAASSAQKAQLARERGASEVLVYPSAAGDSKSLAKAFKAACPNGADVIFDPVGGDYAEPALRSIAWGGRYLVIGFAAGIPAPPWNLALLKGCAIVGVFWGAWIERFPALHQSNNAALLAMYERRALRPPVSEHFQLEQGGEAIRLLAERKALGKLVVMIS
jgi:NADPH2:quinone reductase